MKKNDIKIISKVVKISRDENNHENRVYACNLVKDLILRLSRDIEEINPELIRYDHDKLSLDIEIISDSIQIIRDENNPLNRNFACGLAEKLINKLFSYIKFNCPPSAREGVINDIPDLVFLAEVKAGDLVLCRTNAPLIKPVLELLQQGRKANIKGKDLLSQLINFVKRFSKERDIVAVDTLLKTLDTYCNYETNKLMRRERFMQAEVLKDKIECIHAISDGCTTSKDVINKLYQIFSDSGNGVLFSSVHRAKGLEANNVFILKNHLMPHPSAKGDIQQVQEQNLKHIAYTRFIDSLTFVYAE